MESEGQSPREPQDRAQSKEPYRAPRIEESGTFERLVLNCGHFTVDDCGLGNTNS